VSGAEDKPGDKPADAKAEQARSPGKPVPVALPKRFYKGVSVGGGDGDYSILLDGRPVRTPAKRSLAVPTRALADAIAAEWAAQGERIKPNTMPLSKLAITAIDGVALHAADVAAEIVQFAGSDLLCYRAEAPEELIALQAAAWDPILDWARTELGAVFRLAKGIVPVVQRKEALEKVAAAVAQFDAMALTALHVMTTLLGSAVLALAHAKGRISADEAWAAAHADEDFQISKWGVDLEAAERRAARLREFQAASRFLDLQGARQG
jgi:chaperone required for assembly of F1-ATPase